MIKSLLLIIILLALSSCSTKDSNPNFYPNEYYKQTSQGKVQSDVSECKELANNYVPKGSKWKDVGGTAAESTILGSAAGALGGAIVGNAGRGVGVGAATGALYGIYNGMKNSAKEDPNWQRFVEQCLADKGYQIYGWN